MKENNKKEAFKIGDKVFHPVYGESEVWKVSDQAVHCFSIKKGEREYIKYHFKPTHHTQSSVSEITLITT